MSPIKELKQAKRKLIAKAVGIDTTFVQHIHDALDGHQIKYQEVVDIVNMKPNDLKVLAIQQLIALRQIPEAKQGSPPQATTVIAGSEPDVVPEPRQIEAPQGVSSIEEVQDQVEAPEPREAIEGPFRGAGVNQGDTVIDLIKKKDYDKLLSLDDKNFRLQTTILLGYRAVEGSEASQDLVPQTRGGLEVLEDIIDLRERLDQSSSYLRIKKGRYGELFKEYNDIEKRIILDRFVEDKTKALRTYGLDGLDDVPDEQLFDLALGITRERTKNQIIQLPLN